MSINIPITPAARNPRAAVQLNGLDTRWMNVEITEKNFYLSDTFRCEIPVYDNYNGIDLDYWAEQSDILVEIFIGFPPDPQSYSSSNLDSMFQGKVDNVAIDPVRGLVTITGRDLSSLLIDKKTTEYFPSKTASEIVTKFANDVGLVAVVKPTTKDVGKYAQQFSKITRQRSLWDVCTFLADQEDFNLFVTGQELHFEPKPTLTTEPYRMTFNTKGFNNNVPSGSFLNVQFSRSLTLAQDVIVEVRSFSAKEQRAFKVRATSKHAKAATTKGTKRFPRTPQTYVFEEPNLSREQASQLAQKKLKDITEHEILLTIDLPGDNLLSKTDILQMSGTGTALDQIYFMNTIDRRISVEDGYFMHVTAKNHDTNTQVTL